MSHNKRSTTRRLAWAALPLAAALSLTAGCSNSDSDAKSKSDEREDAAKSKAVEPVFELKTNPGTAKGFTEAPQDVSDMTCEQDGKDWNVSGTVTNPTKKTVDYRIYTYLQDKDSARGLLETDVEGVTAKQDKKWEGSITIDADDLECILRVERTPVK